MKRSRRQAMNKFYRTVILLAFFAAMILAATPAVAEPLPIHHPDFLVGAAQVDISPINSQILGGYGVYFGNGKNCRWSNGVHDPLLATALYFQIKGDRLVIVETDLLGLVGKDANDIRDSIAAELAMSRDRIIVAASHTHHSPDTIGLWGTIIPTVSGRDEKYMDHVKKGALEAALAAFASREKADMYYAVGEEKSLHFNTYISKVKDPPIDDTLTVLKFTRNDGEIIATLTNWGCHPTTENEKNRLVSSDWVDAYRAWLSKDHEGVHMFVNGSIGAAIQPSVPWRNRHLKNDGQGFAWAEAMGKALAQKASALLDSPDIQKASFNTIEARSAKVPMRMKNPVYMLAKDIDLLAMDLPPYGAPYETQITAVKMGPVRFGTTPGEMSPQLGIPIRESLGGNAQVLVGLGQDWLGYIIDKNQYYDSTFVYERLLCISPDLAENLISAYRKITFLDD